MKLFSLNKLQEQALEEKIINMRLKVSKKFRKGWKELMKQNEK